MTRLFRGNSQGEILDADGRVVGRIVPVEATDEQLDACKRATWIGANYACIAYDAMLSAAPADWTSVAVRVPERSKVPPFGWLPDDGGEVWAEGFNACLGAIKGAK